MNLVAFVLLILGLCALITHMGYLIKSGWSVSKQFKAPYYWGAFAEFVVLIVVSALLLQTFGHVKPYGVFAGAHKESFEQYEAPKLSPNLPVIVTPARPTLEDSIKKHRESVEEFKK